MDENVDLPLPISYGELMFAVGSTFTVKAVDMVSQLMKFQFQLTQDFTMNYLGREGASTPFENGPRVTPFFSCWKGYHNSNGPLVDAIKEVRQYGKRPWHESQRSEKFATFDENHLI